MGERRSRHNFTALIRRRPSAETCLAEHGANIAVTARSSSTARYSEYGVDALGAPSGESVEGLQQGMMEMN